MRKISCPNCGHEIVPDTTCPGCGHAANGRQPAPPPEVANWNIEHASPDVLAWARQTFNEAEFLAAKREVEQGGGHRFEDFIDEIERKINGTHAIVCSEAPRPNKRPAADQSRITGFLR